MTSPQAILIGAAIIGGLIGGAILDTDFVGQYQLAGGSDSVFVLDTSRGDVVGICWKRPQYSTRADGSNFEVPGFHGFTCYMER